VKKIKAIIFQQRNIPYNKSDFYLNGYKLEKVLKYKYLGNLIEVSGKFPSTHIELSKKGSKVMFSMFKYLNPIENVSIKIYKNLNLLLNLYSCITQKFGIWISMKKYLRQLQANKSNSNVDLIDLLDTSFLEKVNLKFCKFVLGISKKSVNIAARADISQYPVDVYVKLPVLKYMARISNKVNNPLLLDAYSLSKTLHLNGTYSWYTFAENILNTNEITEKNIEVTDVNKEKWHLTKSLKKNITRKL
jgi:hypothetical protein